MAVLPKFQLKLLFESGDLITQTTLYDLIDATYNPILVAGSNVTLNSVVTPSGTTITVNATGGGSGVVTGLTTTGTSGASTLSSGILNIPIYSGDTYSLKAGVKAGSSVPLNLDAATGADTAVKLTEGTGITLTQTSATEITIDAAGGGAGNPGATGAQGSSGAQGSAGTIGATGAGIIGASGAQGSAGGIGASGAQGSAGTIGATGTGSIGASGAQGSAGTIGASGAQGGAGAIGASGAQGSAGTIGATGSGTTGATGAGTIGASGASGAQGGAGNIGATGSSAGGGSLIVKDEGVQVGATGYTTMNFVGTDVLAEDSGISGQVNIYIPTPTFLSHFNTTDGTNDASVDANLYPFNDIPRISSPTSEGNPFQTGSGSNTAWAGSNKAAYTSPSNGTINYQTVAACTGFSADATGDAKIAVTVYAADGTTALETFTTSTLYQNGTLTSGSGDISVTIGSIAADLPTKFSATVSITVIASDILTTAGYTGGRYHVGFVMTTDTATDGAQTFSYFGPNGNSSTSYNGETNDVFFDTNPSTPNINGTTTIIESTTPASILTKHLSGVEYYILNSQFELDVTDIDNFNANTQGRGGDAQWNFRVQSGDYGLPTRQLEAWGLSVGSMPAWTNQFDVQNVAFIYDNWAINNTNYRFRNIDAFAQANVYDPWSTGNTVNSAGAIILIDTYNTTGNSNQLRERFDDEQFRLERTGTYTAFNPIATLTGSGLANQTGSASPFCQACTVGSNVVRPTQFFKDNGDNPQYASLTGALTTYKPDKTGSNPDYTVASYQVTSTYHRLMHTTGSLIDPIASYEIAFTGDPVGASFYEDLESEKIRFYIRKENEASGGAGNIGYAAVPLSLHGSAPFTTILDPPSGIDTTSSACRTTVSGPTNTIAGTFGGFNATEGFYMELQIVDSAIRIDQIVIKLIYANGNTAQG